ncbi:uncharacterized protein N7515_001337 [Penicillium bovifimosum]|uniref:Uncharacterized protein n=1 Tax=Penicillium bovifimosum TaxID=126998 RepID=A0A9W9H9J2_9EURO|nr:uncharacterized protein N7515_001337 [Penicillium bovifimosum]KAJ5142550.1 hypothetical protein N7515_001337 [Penicillium bovifimosum]
MSTTQYTRLITRNIPQVKRGRQLQNSRVTLVGSPAPSHNPTIDSDRLPYRLYELSLNKIRQEAHAAAPDLRHVIAGISMQKVVSSAVRDDLQHRIDMAEPAKAPSTLPILPGADEPFESEGTAPRAKSNSDPWDMETLNRALYEMERATKRGNVAKTVCFRLIGEM